MYGSTQTCCKLFNPGSIFTAVCSLKRQVGMFKMIIYLLVYGLHIPQRHLQSRTSATLTRTWESSPVQLDGIPTGIGRFAACLAHKENLPSQCPFLNLVCSAPTWVMAVISASLYTVTNNMLLYIDHFKGRPKKHQELHKSYCLTH